MTSCLVTYDLSAPGQKYDKLIEHLKSYGTYSHSLQSAWLIVSDKSAKEIRDAAGAFLDENDKLLVVELTSVAAWRGLRRATSDWIHKNL
ncbi:hypothetical protein [Frigoribacterium sp. Leaf44]|uniref:hypothetical protein n=1 Tax=Frigoribacterium sp. Leaf44 TaxID=1736220 RepID=UPI0006F23F89|nr:hypothetical protein [Frigoribacterium sp. Leaf44]KQN41236.1 hypothetical protein ASE87_10020 [Frigoribacterium sp. Leaf44]